MSCPRPQTGSLLKEAIECGVSKYPALEGRFPQIAGLQFLMDPTKEPMDRIRDIRIGGKAMIPNKKYKLATTSYLCGGGDGYALCCSQLSWKEARVSGHAAGLPIKGPRLCGKDEAGYPGRSGVQGEPLAGEGGRMVQLPLP